MSKPKRKITSIDKLTPAQEARFAEWADKWIKIGLSTKPADRETFERAIRKCYQFAKLDPPKRIVWVQSPLVMALAAPIADRMLGDGAVNGAVSDAVRGAVNGAVGGAVNGAVSDAVRGAVGGAVSDAVGGAVRGAVRGAVSDAVSDAVDGAVRGAVNGAVGGAVDGAVRDAVRGAVRPTPAGTYVHANWHRYIGGQFWVGGYYWGSPSYVSFFTDVCKLKLPGDMPARAKAYRDVCSSAGWFWPHRDFVVVCERPRIVSRDDQGRLHSETGNAIEFRDGWGVASWHGTRVPLEWIVNRKTMDPSIALTDPSVERRRAAAEIIGWAKILRSLPHRVIDRDPDPQIGTLLDVNLPEAPGSRFVLVRCATGRDFALPVPREMATALAANAWTYGIEPLDLKQLEQRT